LVAAWVDWYGGLEVEMRRRRKEFAGAKRKRKEQR
jgi:hypothetical protein